MSNSLRKSLATNLRSARRAKDLTQDELAHAAGISTDMLGRIEREKASPSLETIVQLAEALSMAPEQLITGAVPASSERRGAAIAQIYSRLSRFSDDQVLLVHGLVDAVANFKP